MDEALAGMPATAATAAGDSIQGALAVAARLGDAGGPLGNAAREAFVAGMHLSALVAAAVMLAGAALAHRWLPAQAAPALEQSPAVSVEHVVA